MSTFVIGHTTYTVAPPWFFADSRCFARNRYRELTPEDHILDPFPHEQDSYDDECIVQINAYCSDIINACTQCVEQETLAPLSADMIRSHAGAILHWMCERFYDMFSTKRHVLSVVANVGACYMWLRFLDQFFELYTLVPAPSQLPCIISWRRVEAYPVVFSDFMFTNATLEADTYNPVRWIRKRMQLRLAAEVRKEVKETAAATELERKETARREAEQRKQKEEAMDTTDDWEHVDVEASSNSHMRMTDEERAAEMRSWGDTPSAAVLTYRKPQVVSLAARLKLIPQAATAAAAAAAAAAATAAATSGATHTPPRAAGSSTTADASMAAARLAENPLLGSGEVTLPPGMSYRTFIDTYRLPAAAMTFQHERQLDASDEDVSKLEFMFECVVKKFHFAAVRELPDMQTQEQWRTLLHTLECITVILIIQFHRRDTARVEVYTRITTWVESQISLLNMCNVEEIDFEPETHEAMKDHLDAFMISDASSELTARVTKSVYLHRMSCGLPYQFFQRNPFQTTERNPISIMNEELEEYDLKYLNATLLHAKPRDIYNDAAHPFHDMFVFVLFGCNLEWNKQPYEWIRDMKVFNYHFIQMHAWLLRALDDHGVHKRPHSIHVLGREYLLSMWRKETSAHAADGQNAATMVYNPTLFTHQTPQQHLLTYGWVLLKDYNGQMEDGFVLGNYFRDLFQYEPDKSCLAQMRSLFDDAYEIEHADDAQDADLPAAVTVTSQPPLRWQSKQEKRKRVEEAEEPPPLARVAAGIAHDDIDDVQSNLRNMLLHVDAAYNAAASGIVRVAEQKEVVEVEEVEEEEEYEHKSAHEDE
jgi:hypothetical protein